MTKLNIYDLYNDVLDNISEEHGGQLGVDRFNRFTRSAIEWLVDYMTGRVVEYDKQLATAKAEISKTQKIDDILFPLIKREIVVLYNGMFLYPDDYEYLIDLRISGTILQEGQYSCNKNDVMITETINKILAGGYGFKQVDVLPHDQINYRLNSSISSIANKPCAEQLGDGFMCYPYLNTGSGFMIYIKKPKQAKLVMKIDHNTNSEIYDDVLSVDPDLHEKTLNMLSRRIQLYYFGSNREGGAIDNTEKKNRIE